MALVDVTGASTASSCTCAASVSCGVYADAEPWSLDFEGTVTGKQTGGTGKEEDDSMWTMQIRISVVRKHMCTDGLVIYGRQSQSAQANYDL